MKNERIYYTVYKITNSINNMIYVGCHCTDNTNDNYMGSGTNIIKAINDLGLNHFKKDILHIYKSHIPMLKKEREIVNEEFIARQDTYNIILGGGGFNAYGCVVVKDTNGNTSMVSVKDKRYLSGELVPIAKGTVNVIDINGKCFQVSVNDERYLSGELVPYNINLVPVKDNKGKNYIVHVTDERYLSGELVHVMTNRVPVLHEGKTISVFKNDPKYLAGEYSVFSKNKVACENTEGKREHLSLDDSRYLSGEFIPLIKGKMIVKDKEGNTYRLDKNDPRILSGELVHVNKGLKMKSEHKKLRSDKLKGIYVGKKSDSYNKCFMYDSNDNQIRIDKSEVDKYTELGWMEGRKKSYKGNTGLKNINNGIISKRVKKEDLQSYLDQGWQLGAMKYKK